jgi:hypothetical protein
MPSSAVAWELKSKTTIATNRAVGRIGGMNDMRIEKM